MNWTPLPFGLTRFNDSIGIYPDAGASTFGKCSIIKFDVGSTTNYMIVKNNIEVTSIGVVTWLYTIPSLDFKIPSSGMTNLCVAYSPSVQDLPNNWGFSTAWDCDGSMNYTSVTTNGVYSLQEGGFLRVTIKNASGTLSGTANKGIYFQLPTASVDSNLPGYGSVAPNNSRVAAMCYTTNSNNSNCVVYRYDRADMATGANSKVMVEISIPYWGCS